MNSNFVSISPSTQIVFKSLFINGCNIALIELFIELQNESLLKQTLLIKNLSASRPIAFKVKTTAPKQYIVRPNCGRIEVGGSAEVNSMMDELCLLYLI